MRNRRRFGLCSVVTALVVFMAVPCDVEAASGSQGVRIRVFSINTSGDAGFLGGKLELDDDVGYDVAYSHQITDHVFVEFSYGVAELDLAFDSTATGKLDFGTTDANPFSAMFQVRQNRDQGFDGYFGIGFTYMDFDPEESNTFTGLFPGFAVETIVDDDAGPTLQLGFDYIFGSSRKLSVGVDARYTMLDTTGVMLLDGDQFSAFNLEVDPLLLGVNFAWRF